MIVVSDTSAITNLIQLDHLHLLEVLFQQIIIPKSVYSELVAQPGHQTIIDKCNWIQTQRPAASPLKLELQPILDPGEIDAIILAKQLSADYLIIDERRGRAVAQAQGIKITGLLGVLVRAKESHLVTEIKPLLDSLVNEIGFHIHPRLYQNILEQVNES